MICMVKPFKMIFGSASTAKSKTAGRGPDEATEIKARGNGGQVTEKG